MNALDLWLDGRLAGTLMRGERDLVEFLYDESYRADVHSTPLSVCMPKSDAGHGPDRVMPWLSNLLPDSDEVRARWAAKFDERRSDPFTLLRHMGEDAPGSVQVVPEGIVPRDAGVVARLTEADIARRVRAIIADPDHWVDDSDDQSRFSLGGNQGKFALARIDGQWFEPNGRAASTHIVKPGMVLASGRTNDEVQAVEFVTMRAARALGIRAAAVDIMDFAGVPTFVTTRYDRSVSGVDGAVTRIHQEDFCQAFAVLPARKYEEDGGPTMADMVQLVGSASSPAYRREDLRTLAELFAFNLLTAGVDAHAKNHSLLHVGGATRLAPAYDLISAHGIWDDDRIAYRSSAAVKYGKERPYRKITGRNLARTADVLGVPRRQFLALLDRVSKSLPGAFEAAVAELPEGLATERVHAMPVRIGEFARGFVDRLRAEDLSVRSIPTFTGAMNRGDRVLGTTWEPGGWRSGRWITGRYRSRVSR
ncbi:MULTISPECIES: type II toxin-antitoxin system HipA family toxin [unclassified Microbacterium]|uniref:type II toxin-antitoxin system HipA family toxin n=1 Tax=unclassified Microbacterium TaxID=2609290 RepID=UPI003018E626